MAWFSRRKERQARAALVAELYAEWQDSLRARQQRIERDGLTKPAARRSL